MEEHVEFRGGKPEAPTRKQNLYKARLKESLPWFVSPLKGLKGKDKKYFHVRHEASMMELFFDLFFVANLATFTQYHEITDSATVLDYVGFFAIMWSTWFHITIYDVRFGPDCVFERLCKLFQFLVFVMFSAVGGSFAPGSEGSIKDYRILQTMAIVLGVSRWLLAMQHTVLAIFVVPKYKKLAWPLILLNITYLISGGAIFATYATFNPKTTGKGYIGWYVVLFVEAVAILTISSFERMLSFKETHINERLALLTMIVIGEGVIGVSKTAGYLWPTTYAPSPGSIVSILSIVVILFLIWAAYFDNHKDPHSDYGTIKQQWWALSHFMLHLGYVGIVEGSNRMAIFYYSADTVLKISNTIEKLCSTSGTPNTVFVSTLNTTMTTLKIKDYDPIKYYKVQDSFKKILNSTTLSKQDCYDNGAEYNEDIFFLIRDSTFKKFKVEPAGDELFLHTFRTAFRYYWVSIALSLFMLLVFLYIVRRHKHDTFEFLRMGWRLVTALICVGIMCVSFLEDPFVQFIASPYVTLCAVALMTITIFVDRIARWAGMVHFKKRYAMPTLTEDDHDHRHDTTKHHTSQDRGSMMVWSKTRPDSYQSVASYHSTDNQEVPLTTYRPNYINIASHDEVVAPGYSTYPNTPNVLGTPGSNGLSPPIQSPPMMGGGLARPETYHDYTHHTDTSYGGAPTYYDPTTNR